MPISKRRDGRTITIVGSSRGERVGLGHGSFSRLSLTNSTLAGNKSMMGYSVLRPGTNTALKIHQGAEELAYVIAGSGKITLKNDVLGFEEGDSIFIPPGVAHGIKNDGKNEVIMVFFFPTPKYPRTTNVLKAPRKSQ